MPEGAYDGDRVNFGSNKSSSRQNQTTCTTKPNKLTTFVCNVFHMTVRLTSSNFKVYAKHNAVMEDNTSSISDHLV